MALKLHEAKELVTKYVDNSSLSASSPCRLLRSGFGAAVGRSWPLSPTECWISLDIVTLSRINVPLPQTDIPSLAQQLQTRRTLLELICQLSATPSCRWRESFESLWWPAVLRPTDFKDEKFLETVHGIESTPKFALSMGRPTLESVKLFFQFLQMDPTELLVDDWKVTWRRKRQKIEICLRFTCNVVDTSILRSLVDGLRRFLTSSEKDEEYPRIEFEITDLWFHNCRFLNGSEDLELLAQIITLPLSTIRSLMLPGVFFNSLRNPAGLQSFQSFARQVLASSSPLRSLDLTRVGIDNNCVGALCSALRYPSRLQKLSIGHTIRGAHTNSRLVWAWIFLAVFHADSGSELVHFDVSGLQLQKDVVEILVAMLESPHPGRTAVLLQEGRLPDGEGCEECELPLDERLFVRLLDGAQAWTSPGSSVAWPQLLPGTLQADNFEYEVMVRLADWLCVLIPGYGFGWVVSSSVRYEVAKPSLVMKGSEARARTGLHSLTYRGLQEQSEGIVKLVQLLGDSLTSLDVPSCGLNYRDLDTILHSCPNLSSLNMTGNLMSDLSPVQRAYEEGYCHISKLGVFVEFVNPTIATQLQALLTHPNGKCLEYLQLETIDLVTGRNKSERATWIEIERALLANITLQCLYLSLPSSETHEVAAEVIKPFHGQILRYDTPMTLKVAFLSVVEHGLVPVSVSSLDHMVLSSIFSFATTSAIRRQVNVRR